MPRLASLCLPDLAIDRIRRRAPTAGPPEAGGAPPPDATVDAPLPPSACSCPRAPGFRPGARWARERAPARKAAAAPDQPVLVTSRRSGQQRVVAALGPAARALGLVPGLPLAQARLLVPGLVVHEADEEGDAAFLARLADFAARRWTPRAAVSGVDGLWLDLDGVAHLFGGEERMAERLLAFCARMGLSARIAVADTPGAAWALARFGADRLLICPPGGECAALAPLPVAALRLDERALGLARRFGVEQVGDLLALPRAPLERRFGASLLTRLDQAIGRASEPFEPVVPEDPPSVLLRFLEPIATVEAIEEAMAESVRRLVAALEKKGRAVRRLRLACERVDGEIQSLGVGTARATRDAAHLHRLLVQQVERIEPGFGLERMTLTASWTEFLGPQPVSSLLAPEGGEADLVPLVDRLAGRLGRGRLYRLEAVESDVPERSVRRVSPLRRPAGWPAWPRPVRLLAPPERIHNVMALLPDQPPRRFTWRGRAYRVRQADGPERILGEWWKRSTEAFSVRDYFQVEEEGGQRFWLFRRGDGEDGRSGDMSWYLHGLFA